MTAKSGKKILVLGGTGAMGVYLVPELAAMGYQVDVVSLDRVEKNEPNINYIQANAKDNSFLEKLLENKYDAIVDFMIYSTEEFAARYKLLLESTSHYIFLSTYRVYAQGPTPIKETSFRLLDVSWDREFLATEDYALYKARQENILQFSGFDNWTIVRPAITYSKFRFQLVTLEADTVIYRARHKKPVLLPEQALPVEGTMSWAGDVGRMLARLLLNPVSFREVYTVTTSEHQPWKQIADYYKEIIGLEYIPVDTETYLSFFGPEAAKGGAKYQLLYDRCFDRVMDNSKVLAATGLRQEDFTSLKKGLERELAALPKDAFNKENNISRRMDEYLRGR